MVDDGRTDDGRTTDGRTDGRTTEHGYTISSPCETDGSGELITYYIILYLIQVMFVCFVCLFVPILLPGV